MSWYSHSIKLRKQITKSFFLFHKDNRRVLSLYDQTEVKISQTAIHRGYALLCDSLESVANKIATDVMNSEYINIDETGHKLVLEGNQSYKKSKKVWVWVAGTLTAAYYHVDLTRSKKAIKTMFQFLIPEAPPPISVSDAYSAYINSFIIKQFCWAHLLRDSKDLECKCEDGKIIHLELTELYRRIKSLPANFISKVKWSMIGSMVKL